MIVPLFWSWGMASQLWQWFCSELVCGHLLYMFPHRSWLPCIYTAVSYSWAWHCIFLPSVVIWWKLDHGLYDYVFSQLPWCHLILLLSSLCDQNFCLIDVETHLLPLWYQMTLLQIYTCLSQCWMLLDRRRLHPAFDASILLYSHTQLVCMHLQACERCLPVCKSGKVLLLQPCLDWLDQGRFLILLVPGDLYFLQEQSYWSRVWLLLLGLGFQLATSCWFPFEMHLSDELV